MSISTQEFNPRPYQVDLYEKAVNENTIIYLPTGAGKTYIAVLLIRKFSADVVKPYDEVGKRTIFIVTTVPLVNQQSQYLARHTGLSCKGFSGDMNVDYWTPEQWMSEISKHHILVMTAQIFLNLLNHGIMTLEKVNLILFDECHRAVEDHPMRLVMKHFQNVPTELQPRVIGLSATLINSNVKLTKLQEQLQTLERTFHAKIITVDDYLEIKTFSTNPQENITLYDPPTSPPLIDKIKNIFNFITTILEKVHLPSKRDLDQSSEVFKPQTRNKKLTNFLTDIMEHLQEMGLYGGDKAILFQMIQLECLKKSVDHIDIINIFNYVECKLAIVRKLIYNEMSGSSELEQIYRFSSDKIIKLITLLKEFHQDETNKKFCCIIFVQRRLTAKVLYHILKCLHNVSEEFKFLVPGYIIGTDNNPYKSVRETLCTTKWNKESLMKFRNGIINCLVSTDVIDEGVDIPICTMIVRYFPPQDFRAYIQSKGRARHFTSKYKIMLNRADYNTFVPKYTHFQVIEQTLIQTLIGKSDNRLNPTRNEIEKDLYVNNLEPYCVINKEGGKCFLTEHSAISVINRYCVNLYKSKFTSLSPTWKLHKLKDDDNLYQVSLQLPILSPLREEIFGIPMSSIELAKRAAALATCIKLHQLGELSDNLLPVDFEVVFENLEHLYPHWKNEPKDEHPGTYERKRRHKLVYPEPLYGAYPKENADLYLHILDAKAVYNQPDDNRRLVFYNLLKKNSGFGILSTKKLPEIPSFPLYMNVGELHVNIQANYKHLKLTEEEIDALKMFHTLIFNKIVFVIKNFMVFDTKNQENSFLIVPVNESWEINWEVVRNHQTIDYIEPSVRDTKDKYSDYDLALITPTYRGCNSVYIVTQVCEDLYVESAFPTDHFYSYSHYFHTRHGLKIKNVKQPMLEVKPISTKINCIKPRSMKPGISKRKRADELEDFEEHLVPELCKKVKFPSLYWLKATMLPSILHRLSQLLIADHLRTTISKEMQIGIVTLSDGKKWKPLILTSSEYNDNNLSDSIQESIEDTIDDASPQQTSVTPEIDMLDTDYKLYSWTPDQEPTDLHRNAEKIHLIDIEYYCNFMMASNKSDKEAVKNKNTCNKYYNAPTNIAVPRLNILQKNNPIGPEPTDILQALTSAQSADAFNLERLETLGDSFLKFAVSLYLHETFPSYGEGILTTIKGKTIGNRNLYYCGEAKSIPGMIKVDEFVPISNSVTPAYSVERNLQNIMLDVEVCPNFLYEFSISDNEKLNGVLSIDTIDEIQDKMLNWTDKKVNTGMEHYLGYQVISDKVVSDAVEALLGVYVKECGVLTATKILKWFEILPKDFSIDAVFFGPPKNPAFNVGNPDNILNMPDLIEKRIGYKFKNRTFLLEAMTHPSYINNQLTGSYQRLEFLGDAVLDFLITAHIFETSNNLTPGGLTDLRSALVNNVTLACLAVRHGLHTTVLMLVPELQEVVDRLVKFQEERNHIIDNELLWILMEEDDCNLAEHVDVPKVLGDIFESIIGAIYLDSGKSLETVWKIIYSIMHEEIVQFSANVPKHPVRALYETEGANPRFSNGIIVQGTKKIMVPLEVKIRGQKKLFHGFGGNKKQAKCAAAKQALKYIKSITQ